MFEYPLVNYRPQCIMTALWFCPGLVLGTIFGWRAHITFLMAQNGELEEEGFKRPINFLAKKHHASTQQDAPTDAINKIKSSLTPVHAEEDDEFEW